MTALLDPTRRPAATRPHPPATPPTTAIPAARRSAPEAIRTAVIAPAPTAEVDPGTDRAPSRRERGTRWRIALLGAALVLAGGATAVGLGTDAPLAPLPAPISAPVAPASACSPASCAGLDPTDQGCQQDARTISSRVVTAERRGIEVPVGVVDVRASAACGAVWARYALDPTAPVAEVSIEGRDGRAERSPVDAVAGHRHLGYGTTPMLAGPVSGFRAVVSPTEGGELPSRATAWTDVR